MRIRVLARWPWHQEMKIRFRTAVNRPESMAIDNGAESTRCRAKCSVSATAKHGLDRSLRRPVQSERRPLRHFVAYGSTNKYIPVKNIKASTATARSPIQFVYLCLKTATPLKMTTSVKAMDSQRCSCRIVLFQFNGTSPQGLV
jgi:hypothetical protein